MLAAKLTLAASNNAPLARWGNGLTVLQEKMFGNIYIDRMREICCLEADYNWLNKFVFAKQMTDKAFQGEIIPVEQFTKMGSQATEGVRTSIRTLLQHSSGTTQNCGNRKCELG
jgi:hypothetical protein